MKLTFIGADHEVTGSCHFLETKDTKLLIDCGMEQGSNIYENAELPISYKELDYIILTHAHIDHSGMIPMAYVHGFRGTILCTSASYDLDFIMLMDSAHIQEMEAEFKNRKGMRAGKDLIVPAYTVEDAQKSMELFKTIAYGEIKQISDSISIRFIDAGHLLGSASVEMWIKEDGIEKKIVFSGDIGNKEKPIIKDPDYIEEADYVLMESTYGDRRHPVGVDHKADLARIMQETLDRGGNVVIPAFAVGRTQELLYLIRHIKEEGLVKGHDGFPVYVDSPMAVEATRVFRESLMECFDAETKELLKQGISPIDFPNLILSVNNEESVAINSNPVPKVILAAAGMCNAGRIRHHLKHNLWRRECSIVFAGYQAEGTLGRVLQDGTDSVKLFGEDIKVAAHIETMGGMSSHADLDGLLEWVGAYKKAPDRVILVHGDDEAMANLAKEINEKYGYTVDCPYSGSVFDLATNTWEITAEPVFKEKEDKIESRNSAVKTELDEAFGFLNSTVEDLKDMTNEDMRKMAAELKALAEKYKKQF